MAYSFRGGIHPHDYKSSTNNKPIETFAAPSQVIMPVSMHIGAPANAIVSVGDTVCVGQKIADSEAFVSSPVHSSISGTVVAIEPRLHPNGTKVMSIVIENDFQDRLHSSVVPKDFDEMSNDERIDAIAQGGIVGLGGATFPTHVKIKSGIGKVDTAILNGAECEPFITSDHRILLEYPQEVVGGFSMLAKILGVKSTKIGIEINKENTFQKIRELIKEHKGMELCPLKCRYPQGAEKQIIYALTKREVPSGKLPADVGCAVFNVDTAAAVYRLFKEGMPVIRRVVTLSGSAVANPKNLYALIGTPLEALVEACGGLKEAPNKLIVGGPMMGASQFSLEIPVVKATNAFLCLCKDEDKRVSEPTCIRCGKCVRVCPMGLLPNYMNLYGKRGVLDECEKLGSLDCIECGSCSYECPARIQLVQQFRKNKQLIMDSKRK